MTLRSGVSLILISVSIVSCAKKTSRVAPAAQIDDHGAVTGAQRQALQQDASRVDVILIGLKDRLKAELSSRDAIDRLSIPRGSGEKRPMRVG